MTWADMSGDGGSMEGGEGGKETIPNTTLSPPE